MLRVFKALRNKFAHRINVKLGDEQTAALVIALAERFVEWTIDRDVKPITKERVKKFEQLARRDIAGRMETIKKIMIILQRFFEAILAGLPRIEAIDGPSRGV